MSGSSEDGQTDVAPVVPQVRRPVPVRPRRKWLSSRVSGALNGALLGSLALMALDMEATVVGGLLRLIPANVETRSPLQQASVSTSNQAAASSPPALAEPTTGSRQAMTSPFAFPSASGMSGVPAMARESTTSQPQNDSRADRLPVPVLPPEMLPRPRSSADVALPGDAQDPSPQSAIDEFEDSELPLGAEADFAPAQPVSGTVRDKPQEVTHGGRDLITSLDAAISPARDHTPSAEDTERLATAFKSLRDVITARSIAAEIKDPVGQKLVDWALLRDGQGSAAEIRAFLDANPAWPNRHLLIQRMEEQIFLKGGEARDIIKLFSAEPPQTGIGRAALASAELASGNESAARELAAAVWRAGEVPVAFEVGFAERFGRLLSADDHRRRFNHYLVDASRWTNDRNRRAEIARRVIKFLPESEQKQAQARLAVYQRARNADALMSAAIKERSEANASRDWGFEFQHIDWHRQRGRHEQVWTLLASAPTDRPTAINPDQWWLVRRASAYSALAAGKDRIAYNLVTESGDLGTEALKDQAFLAGFIALRHLKDAHSAEAHFQALLGAADGPLSRGKAGYWLARTYDALNDPVRRKQALQAAALSWDTFYGQIAQLTLEPDRVAFNIAPPGLPNEAQARAFNDNELVKAVVLARKSGLPPHFARLFLIRLAQDFSSDAELAMTAHLAEAIGDAQMAVRIGKSGVARGFNLAYYAYPINAMPEFEPLRPSPEPALMLAIARQESEFNTVILSNAGARGLMQVMPTTAQQICKDYRIKCEIDRLTSDPSYNLMLGTAYIGDQIDQFGGSYILAIAAYNAGPGRARRWLREFGDPRRPNVDPIDWIHRIPFEETRDYVKKVLSNLQVYRARLGGNSTALQLKRDLNRVASASQQPSRNQ